MSSITSYLQNLIKFDFSSPGLLLGGLVVIFLVLWGLSLGRTRAMISLLALYIAYAIESVFPYYDNIREAVSFTKDSGLIVLGFFLISYVAVFIALNGSLVKSRLTIKESSIVTVLIVSMLELGLIISIVMNIVSIGDYVDIPSNLTIYFDNVTALFYWLLAPIIFVIFIKKD